MADHPTGTGLLAALGALGWLVFLSGVGATQAACGAANYESGGAAGFLGPVSCGELFSFAWWIVIYEALSPPWPPTRWTSGPRRSPG